MTDTRERARAAQYERLRTLEGRSSILVVQASGPAPRRYTLEFRGRGLEAERTTGRLALADHHRCELRLPEAFPDVAPDVQWLTPLVHPNISFSGFVQLEDLGLPWNSGMGLEVVCERMWDALRLAYVDWHNVVNPTAATRLQQECAWALPLDLRPLRDRDRRPLVNRMRYRRGSYEITAAAPTSPAASDEILVIDEHSLAESLDSTPAAESERDGVLYIGDDPPASS